MNILENDDLQKLILNSMQSKYDFNYFFELFKENKFFDYYAKLSNNDKRNVVFFIQLANKNSNNLFENKVGSLANEIKKWQNDLIKRLDSEKISNSELEFSIKLIADSIINNEQVDDNLIIKIAENYILKSPLKIAEELPILLLYNLYLINKFVGSKYNISFTSDTKAFAQANYYEFETVFINYDIYHQLFELEKIKEQDYYEMFCYQTFALLHEIKHLIQYDYINNHDDEYAKVIGLEMCVISYDYDFYLESHDLFFMEREANEFGFSNLKNYCQNFVSKEYIQKFIDIARSQILSNKLSQKKFKIRFDEICDQIKKSISSDDKKPNF